MSAITTIDAVAMPAMALGLNSVFGVSSVEAIGVAVAVLEVEVWLLEESRLTLLELVRPAVCPASLVAELSKDAEAEDVRSLEKDSVTAEVLGAGAAVIVSSVVGGGAGELEAVGRGTGRVSTAELVRLSDRVRLENVLCTVGMEASELDCMVVMSLTVAVMVSAMFAIAPFTPSHMVYPLSFSISAPKQLEMTHCRDPSPMVRPDMVLVVHKVLRSAVEEHVC